MYPVVLEEIKFELREKTLYTFLAKPSKKILMESQTLTNLSLKDVLRSEKFDWNITGRGKIGSFDANIVYFSRLIIRKRSYCKFLSKEFLRQMSNRIKNSLNNFLKGQKSQVRRWRMKTSRYFQEKLKYYDKKNPLQVRMFRLWPY